MSVDAFSIGLPDIPFLNFNFQNDSPKKHSSSIIDFGAIANNIPKVDSNEDTENDDSVSSLDKSYQSNNNKKANTAESQPASLPFPANVANAVHSNEDENTDETKKLPLPFTYTLPLVGDYSDGPATYLSGTVTNEADEIPGQYIVVFKHSDTTVTDFLSILSSKIDIKDVKVLQIDDNVINGLTIKVPNDKVLQSIEQLPIIDYVEKDVMAEAFAQTIPSAVFAGLSLDTESFATNLS